MSVTTEHARALAAMIATQTRAKVYLSRPQDPKPVDFPYVVLSMAPSGLDTDRLAAAPHRADVSFQTTSVGLTVESAQIVGDAVQRAFALTRPIVEGRSCGRVHQTAEPYIDAQDVSLPDRTVSTVIDRWSFVSRAAV